MNTFQLKVTTDSASLYVTRVSVKCRFILYGFHVLLFSSVFLCPLSSCKYLSQREGTKGPKEGNMEKAHGQTISL